ncbi:hypothetical protein ON010_g15782 [Phytophthora cinnamomi]|nr:hypothetical protein ON010_g15782 [Phytophthora cinnamomi]
MDVDTLVGSHGVEVATTTHSPGVNAHVDPITTQIPTSSSDGFDGVQVAVGSADDSTSGAKTASSGYPEERSSILQGMSTPKVTSTEETPSPATSSGLTTITEETLSPATGSNFTASSEATAVSTEAPSLTNSTTPGSHNGSEEVVKVLSLTASNSSSSESESGSEGWVSTSTVTPNSVAEATFTLLAADIIGAFYNLGEEDPLTRKSKWWITISLPSGWRFVAWENTAVDVTLRDDNNESTAAHRVHSCADVTNSRNCDSDSHRYGFVSVMGLLNGREDLMASNSGGPMSFVLSKSIVTGTSASSSSVGVSVSLSYETSTGTLKSAATSRRTRELTVITSGSTIASTSAEDLSALTLATMALPPVRRGHLDSSLLWMEEDTEIMMLSFSTSSIVGPNSDNPKVCANLRSSSCASKGRKPVSTVSFGSSAAASYVQGGNPFLNLYADPGETNLNIESDNSTYFCVTDLLPSGVKTNDSWEIRTTFTFQIQVTNVAWTGNEDQEDDYTSGFRLPPLSEVILMDDNDVMGSDCAQTLVHAKTCT